MAPCDAPLTAQQFAQPRVPKRVNGQHRDRTQKPEFRSASKDGRAATPLVDQHRSHETDSRVFAASSI